MHCTYLSVHLLTLAGWSELWGGTNLSPPISSIDNLYLNPPRFALEACHMTRCTGGLPFWQIVLWSFLASPVIFSTSLILTRSVSSVCCNELLSVRILRSHTSKTLGFAGPLCALPLGLQLQIPKLPLLPAWLSEIAWWIFSTSLSESIVFLSATSLFQCCVSAIWEDKSSLRLRTLFEVGLVFSPIYHAAHTCSSRALFSKPRTWSVSSLDSTEVLLLWLKLTYKLVFGLCSCASRQPLLLKSIHGEDVPVNYPSDWSTLKMQRVRCWHLSFSKNCGVYPIATHVNDSPAAVAGFIVF